jgi:hypothetical protein
MSMTSIDGYPTWVEVVNTGTTTTTTTRPTSPLRSALGWRDTASAADIKRALIETFPITVVDGHNVVEVRDRGFRLQTSGNGSTVASGAQLALHTRAKAIVEQMLPLLGLDPLSNEPDDENIAAIKALIGPALTELLDQFGAEGGPTVARVDNLFELLVGYDTKLVPTTPETDSYLSDYGIALGLEDDAVNTITEELAVTEYTTLCQYGIMLTTIWHVERAGFLPNAQTPYLGTQSVLIERALTCVLQSARETERAYDSILIGEDDRLARSYTLAGGQLITLANLLSWTEDVATSAFGVIDGSGKYGITRSVLPTLTKLLGIVAEVQTKDNDVHPRVAVALASLHDNLQLAIDAVGNLQPPDLDDEE